jgi:amidohydrolase
MRKNSEGSVSTKTVNSIKKWSEFKPQLVELRRRFHRIPELGFEEIETSRLIKLELDRLGIKYQSGIGKTGILAQIEGKKKKPILLLRFDMDGLPIQEGNEVDYKSLHPGRMHACGHDCHIATGLVLTKLLLENREELNGSIEIFFQPAEENFGGAEALLKSGLLEKNMPDHALAFHVWNERPVKWVGVAPGPVMAGDDVFRIQISGLGGHGAMPNKTIDPIAAGASIVQSLQSIVARNIDPLRPAVLSVTKFSAGETYNVIPEKVELLGTLRYFDNDIHKLLIKRLYEIVKNGAQAFGCKAELKVTHLTPALINNPRTTKIISEALQENHMDIEIDGSMRTMGSEDMALILEKIPGTYLFIGSSNSTKEKIFGHHHPRFDIDEDALPIALQVLFLSVFAILNK